MENYFEFLVYDVSTLQEDLVSAFCFENGAGGISESLLFKQNFENYKPETIPTETHNLVAYFEIEPSKNFITNFQNEFPDIFFELKEKKNKDWMEEWKKGFHSFALVNDYWVVPSWEKDFNKSDKFMKIDPGMAFGTGTHETTQIAAQLVFELFGFTKANSESGSEIKTALDVGTGTGILAILCEMLGANKIKCTEIDPVAREVAQENVVTNKMKYIEVLNEQVDSINGKNDLVIANIIDGVLVQIQEDLNRLTDNYLILTGILNERENLFLGRYDLSGFDTVKKISSSEWQGYLLKKRES